MQLFVTACLIMTCHFCRSLLLPRHLHAKCAMCWSKINHSFAWKRFRKDLSMFFNTMVVDDDSQVRRFVSTVLRNEGWNVFEAESAESALDMMHDRHWSVVFRSEERRVG